MVTIAIIGSGNVAQHLIQAFSESGDVELIQVLVRNEKAVSHLITKEKIITNYNDLKDIDVYFIAVSDNAIVEVSKKIPYDNQLVVHTSGSIAMTDLDDKNRKGVFYPLQTFSKNRAINFSEVAICLESQNPKDYKILEKIAGYISKSHYSISSEQRKALHVSAVFVNNFVNHMYQIGSDICEEHEVPFDILKSLIQETANKIQTLSPKKAQTGPAKREDTKTINSHLTYLTNENQKDIYKILTKSIIDNDKKL